MAVCVEPLHPPFLFFCVSLSSLIYVYAYVYTRNYETVHAGVEISAPRTGYSVAFMEADIAISAREASSVFALATGWRFARVIIATSAGGYERRRKRRYGLPAGL